MPLISRVFHANNASYRVIWIFRMIAISFHLYKTKKLEVLEIFCLNQEISNFNHLSDKIDD